MKHGAILDVSERRSRRYDHHNNLGNGARRAKKNRGEMNDCLSGYLHRVTVLEWDAQSHWFGYVECGDLVTIHGVGARRRADLALI
jgi:hypothetical protein